MGKGYKQDKSENKYKKETYENIVIYAYPLKHQILPLIIYPTREIQKEGIELYRIYTDSLYLY